MEQRGGGGVTEKRERAREEEKTRECVCVCTDLNAESRDLQSEGLHSSEVLVVGGVSQQSEVEVGMRVDLGHVLHRQHIHEDTHSWRRTAGQGERRERRRGEEEQEGMKVFLHVYHLNLSLTHTHSEGLTLTCVWTDGDIQVFVFELF